jgi:hypothetical protein
VKLKARGEGGEQGEAHLGEKLIRCFSGEIPAHYTHLSATTVHHVPGPLQQQLLFRGPWLKTSLTMTGSAVCRWTAGARSDSAYRYGSACAGSTTPPATVLWWVSLLGSSWRSTSHIGTLLFCGGLRRYQSCLRVCI